jgi:UDP-glucose 6-dehydrogenase
VGTARPNGEANLSYLESAAHSIGAAMDINRFRVVVNKSTVPVGSGNLVETLLREGIREALPGNDKSIRFGVATNPEFLRKVSAITDSLYPDRIVLEAEEERTMGNAEGACTGRLSKSASPLPLICPAPTRSPASRSSPPLSPAPR